MIELARTIKTLCGGPVYAHFQPHWWGPHYEGGDERAWWRAAGPALDGLLYQMKWDDDEAKELDLYLRLPGGPHDGGIVGRMTQELGKLCVCFEHSRELNRWRRIVSAVQSDGRSFGWC